MKSSASSSASLVLVALALGCAPARLSAQSGDDGARVEEIVHAIRLNANLDRGGVVEHIRVRNFTVESFDNLFWFQLNYPGLPGGGHPSTYRDILFENVVIGGQRVDGRLDWRAEASPAGPVQE